MAKQTKRSIRHKVRRDINGDRRRFIVVVGKSGSGKDYLTSAFALKRVVSYTTRPRRTNEKNGDSHHFVSEAELFRTNPDLILGYTEFDEHAYWFTYRDLEGKDVIIADPAGLDFLMHRMGHKRLHVVYIKAPWWKRLVRMIRRDGVSLHSVRKSVRRMIHDRQAFAAFERGRTYDAVIYT